MAAAKKKESSSSKILQDIIDSVSKEEDRYPVPTSVLVVGRNVPIKLVKDCPHDGEFDPYKLGITIKDGQVSIEEMDTLLHETMHAIDHWLDLGLSERQIRVMATGLIGVFQDNPDFADFVTRPMKPTDL